MSDEVLERLATVFRVVFTLAPGMDPMETRQITTPKWDSLGHVSLVTALESEFEVEISAADSLEITSFEAAALILEEILSDLET